MINPALQERLRQIDEAISAVMVTGQEYRHEGRLVRRADLSDLRAMRNQITAEIAAASCENTAVAEFDGR